MTVFELAKLAYKNKCEISIAPIIDIPDAIYVEAKRNDKKSKYGLSMITRLNNAEDYLDHTIKLAIYEVGDMNEAN